MSKRSLDHKTSKTNIDPVHNKNNEFSSPYNFYKHIKNDLLSDKHHLGLNHNFIESQSQKISSYLEANNLGNIRIEGDLSSYYADTKHQECESFDSPVVEEKFVYNFGGAVYKAARTETNGQIDAFRTETVIDEMLESHNEWYFEDEKTLTMKKGVYDLEAILDKKDLY